MQAQQIVAGVGLAQVGVSGHKDCRSIGLLRQSIISQSFPVIFPDCTYATASAYGLLPVLP